LNFLWIDGVTSGQKIIFGFWVCPASSTTPDSIGFVGSALGDGWRKSLRLPLSCSQPTLAGFGTLVQTNRFMTVRPIWLLARLTTVELGVSHFIPVDDVRGLGYGIANSRILIVQIFHQPYGDDEVQNYDTKALDGLPPIFRVGTGVGGANG